MSKAVDHGRLEGFAHKLPLFRQLLAGNPSTPAPLRMMNATANFLGNGWIGLDPDQLMRAAERRTRLSDWGDAPFREALERLLESANCDAQLNATGRLLIRNYVNRILDNRLKIERDLQQHPAILDEEIRRPVFIVGLPRTGSTLLQRLLARDPQARSLQTWEMLFPSPPPEAATYDCDPRIAVTEKRLKMLDWMAPEFASAHELVAGEPEECVSLLQNTLQTYCFDLFGEFSTYRDWLASRPQLETYAYYRMQLQLLQFKTDKDHWVLKSPFHLWGLDALLKTFPDAIIIQTHRDPVQVTPSLCSLFSVMHRLCSDATELESLGPVWLERLAQANEIAIDLRQTEDERFIDLGYRELVSNPIKAARTIYERCGYTLSPTALTAMQSWMQSNPQHKRGKHHYTLEMFGLDTPRVEQRFARYRERFAEFL